MVPSVNRGLFAIFSDALHNDIPAHSSSWLVFRASELYTRNLVKTPRFFPVPI
jgi:hypothetical protein